MFNSMHVELYLVLLVLNVGGQFGSASQADVSQLDASVLDY